MHEAIASILSNLLSSRQTSSAEKLREYGLSHICSHPMLVTRTRSCPLIAPPKPPPVPPWKLFRQKREAVITDEPQGMVCVVWKSFCSILLPMQASYFPWSWNLPALHPKPLFNFLCALKSTWLSNHHDVYLKPIPDNSEWEKKIHGLLIKC